MEERECSVRAQKMALPLSSTPSFDLHCSTFWRAALMWGDSEQTLSRGRLKAHRGAAVFLSVISPSRVKRFCQQLISSSSLPPSASQPFSPSFIQSFLLFVCSFCSSSSALFVLFLRLLHFVFVRPCLLFVHSFIHSFT